MIDKLFAEYASSHQSKLNILTHFIGIPLIVYAILVMLSWVPIVGWVTAAEVLIVAATIFYLTLDRKLAILMLTASVLLDVFAWLTPTIWIGVGAFVVGWVIQFFGHAVFEKKSPSFMKNLVHLLVGPIFIINEVARIRRIPKS